MLSPDPFGVDVSRIGRALVVAPKGEIDIATAPAVRDGLQRREADVTLLVLDLRGVEFMDTSGLQLLIEGRRASESGGPDFAVVRGPKAVQRLLDIAGISEHLRLVDAPEEAVASGHDPG